MRKGWFKIDGVQEGDRTLEQQILGLDNPAIELAGHTVLELGCAEGLMTRWLLQVRGAASVHAVDVISDHLKVAHEQCRGVKGASFELRDLSFGVPMGVAYDTVIALAVVHKLKHPERAAAEIAAVSKKQIILRLPPATAPVVVDRRSGHVPHNVEQPILSRGFKRVALTSGSFDEWTAVYRR